MHKWVLLCAAAVVLSGCAGGGGTLIPAGVYSPVGPRGAKHCEASNHCVVETGTGQVHFSIGEQSALTIGFAGGGGNVKHYYDYLVTIKNIGEADLYFDPNQIRDYDPDAALDPVREREKSLQGMKMSALLLTVLGEAPNTADIEYMETTISEDRAVTEAQTFEQHLEAQLISPGAQVGGRIVVKATQDSPERFSISIPVGSDIHTVSFTRKSAIARRLQKQMDENLYISDASYFDGRWLSIDKNVYGFTNMRMCDLRTEGNRIFEECDDGRGIRTGIVRKGIASLDRTPNAFGIELIAVDQNTLKYEYPYGKGIYERQ